MICCVLRSFFKPAVPVSFPCSYKRPLNFKDVHRSLLLSGVWVSVAWLQVGLNLLPVPPIPGIMPKEQLLPVAGSSSDGNGQEAEQKKVASSWNWHTVPSAQSLLAKASHMAKLKVGGVLSKSNRKCTLPWGGIRKSKYLQTPQPMIIIIISSDILLMTH